MVTRHICARRPLGTNLRTLPYGSAALALLVVLILPLGAEELILDNFDYPDVAAARAAWKPAEQAQPAELAPHDHGAALKLICDREKEVESFIPEEYWTIEAALKSQRSTISAVVQPAATPAPMIAPMLVPPTRSIVTPASRSARTTPMWAKPRAPPPESTSPTAWPVSRPSWIAP